MARGSFFISMFVFLFSRTLIPSVNAGTPRVYREKCSTVSETTTCDDILKENLISNSCVENDQGVPCSNYTDIKDDYFFKYAINRTHQFQPSIKLEVNSTAYRNHNGYTVVDAEGYIVGYRDCRSNPMQVCYVFIDPLPSEENDWTHILVPPSDSLTLSVGDQCTLFGCFQYCLFGPSRCVRVRRDFISENITILGTCPSPGTRVEHGNLTIFSQSAQMESGHYIEGTEVTVTCDVGYIASDGGKGVCQGNGTWSYPNCTKITCPQYNQSFNNSWIIEVFAPEEGAVEGHYIEGTIVAVSCTQGYSGGGNSTCQINGRWTAVTCSLITCPNPDQSFNNSQIIEVFTPEERVMEDRYVEGTIVTVSCNTGSGNSTCLINGSWTEVTCSSFPSEYSYGQDVTVILVTTVLSVGVVTFLLCIAVCLKVCQRSRKDKIQMLNDIITLGGAGELLDPSFKPIELYRHKKLPISLSLDDDYITALCNAPSSLALKVGPCKRRLSLETHVYNTDISGDKVDNIAKETSYSLINIPLSAYVESAAVSITKLDMSLRKDSPSYNCAIAIDRSTEGHRKSALVDITDGQGALYSTNLCHMQSTSNTNVDGLNESQSEVSYYVPSTMHALAGFDSTEDDEIPNRDEKSTFPSSTTMSCKCAGSEMADYTSSSALQDNASIDHAFKSDCDSIAGHSESSLGYASEPGFVHGISSVQESGDSAYISFDSVPFQNFQTMRHTSPSSGYVQTEDIILNENLWEKKKEKETHNQTL